MNTYKSLLPLMGNRNVVICNLSKDEELDKTLKVVREDSMPIHHIQIIDRSYSMLYELDKLVENLKDTIRNMKETDFYTVIWFSSENQYSVILKGVSATSDKESSFKLLDTLKSPVSRTCFYQATSEALKVSDELVALCDNISITLFTDGQSTTNGDESKMSDLLSDLSENIIAFNTIGYGNYCNEDELLNWAMKSQYGTYTHSSKIEEYFEIFDSNYEVIENLERNKVNIKIPDNCKGYYLTNKSVKYFESELNLNFMDKGKNQIIIVGDNTENSEFEFSINDIGYSSSDIKNSISDRWIEGLLYKIAYCNYKENSRRESLQVLRNLCDKELIDSHMSAFTCTEVENHVKKLKKAAYQTKFRNPDSCAEDYFPADDAPCLMDILEIICSDNENKYYSDASPYSRVGRKVTDEFNMFHKNPDDNGLRDINDIVFNEKKLNVSIRFRVPGYVSINPKQAKEVSLDKNVPCIIYRTHTIVKDGNLNIDYLNVKINQSTMDKISKLGVDGLFKKVDVDLSDKMYDAVLDLNTIPVTNVLYDNMKTEEIFEMVNRLTVIKGYMKAVKYFLSEKSPFNKKTSYKVESYTEEQIKLLEQYGIDKDRVYRGIANKTPKVDECDFYMSRTVEFVLKGFSSLSSVEKVLNNQDKKGDIYLKEGIDYVKDMSYEDLIKYRKDLSKESSKISCKLCACKIAKILTGDFFDKVEPTSKGNVYTHLGSNGQTMNIKIDYEKVYF